MDPRLLQKQYPMKCRAYIETGRTVPLGGFRLGRKLEGVWRYGTAVGVYRVGSTPLFVVFVSNAGDEYIIEHSEQLWQ